MALKPGKRLLYFSPATYGGMADYARMQANALADLGVEVEVLSSAGFPIQIEDRFTLSRKLVPLTKGTSRLSSRIATVKSIMHDYSQLALTVRDGKFQHVLLGAYAEYLAPLWAKRLTQQARAGAVFGAVVHDPVRDYVVGPKWWHRRSIACAYSFLREAFVHESIKLDTGRSIPRLRTSVIPHGIYAFPHPTVGRERFRKSVEIPDAADVWLSFGHIRDGKNLDLVIRALAHFPNAYLIVAGKEQSQGQKPLGFYQHLARQCGVAQRCVWLNRFIAIEEVGSMFAGSDLVLLTYSKDFHSASGVLNAAIYFRKPCLVSSGDGNLKTMVAKYGLGIWVEPDRVETIIEGLKRWAKGSPCPDWETYELDNSWQLNAEIVIDRMFEGQR